MRVYVLDTTLIMLNPRLERDIFSAGGIVSVGLCMRIMLIFPDLWIILFNVVVGSSNPYDCPLGYLP